jgi:hypothetical protein
MAGRKCKICEHKDRNKIDLDIASKNGSLRAISDRYSVPIGSLKRHKESGHVIRKIARAAEAKEVTAASDLLLQVQDLSKRALSILSQAEGTGDLRTACSAIREVRSTIELLLKVSGELKGDQTNVNVAVITHEYRLVKGVDAPVRE